MSILSLKYEKNYERLYKNIVIRLVGTFLVAVSASLLIWMVFWNINSQLTNLILGLINIFILLAIFLIAFNSHSYKKSLNILCPGFLIVSIVDCIHTYDYSHLLQDIEINGVNISLKYWMVARVLEIIVLFIHLCGAKKLASYRNTIILCFGMISVNLILILHIQVLQFLNVYDKYTLNTIKIILSSVSLGIAIYMINKIKDSFTRNVILESRYLYLSIFFVISAEISSVFLEGVSSFWVILVTILRTCSYLYLYKGVFEDLIGRNNQSINKEMKTYRKNHHVLLNSSIKKEPIVKSLSLNVEEILNAVSVPTIIVDYKGKIVVCSESYANLVDMEYSDIINTNINEIIKIIKLTDKNIPKKFDFDNYKNKIDDWLIKTPKGNKKYVQVTFSIITDNYNDKIGVVCVMHDITRIKEEQKKLINQEKLALMGQMGATIVHETRNFLTTIKGNSQLIELYCNNDKIKKYAQKINCDTNEVNRIITDFLNLSKPRETELVEVAFSDLVLSMRNTIETSSLMNNSQLVLDIDYDERYILCDETQIKQVILNICKNAVESMDKVLNPTLKISTGLDEECKEVFINISDNGTGIDEETIKKIGTPFFTTKKTGTGLGLNACYQIIKEHEGRIEIQSKLGVGTTFKIVMPYIDEDIEDEII